MDTMKEFLEDNLWTDACGGIPALASCDYAKCNKSAVCTTSKYCCECPVGVSGGECNQVS